MQRTYNISKYCITETIQHFSHDASVSCTNPVHPFCAIFFILCQLVLSPACRTYFTLVGQRHTTADECIEKYQKCIGVTEKKNQFRVQTARWQWWFLQDTLYMRLFCASHICPIKKTNSMMYEIPMTGVTPTAQCHNTSVTIWLPHVPSTLKHATGSTTECATPDVKLCVF